MNCKHLRCTSAFGEAGEVGLGNMDARGEVLPASFVTLAAILRPALLTAISHLKKEMQSPSERREEKGGVQRNKTR